MEKQNDWIAVNLNNQDIDFDDLRVNDITPENTDLKDKEFYKESKKVKDLFTDSDTGKFKDDEYNQFYDTMLYAYNQYSKDDYINRSFKSFEYGPYQDAPKGAKRVEDLYKIQNISNPFKQKIGVEGYNVTSKRQYSIEELAQMNNIRDYQTDEDLGYSLNDSFHGGLVGLFNDPTTVVAQWDEDGMHYDKQLGRDVAHKKRDYKYNENGDFYLETLGDRESYGKRVINWTDTLTTDGSFMNKFDFMDSDGIDKSVVGTVMKTAVKIIPLFIPYVGEVYAYGLIGTELMNVIPEVYKAVDSWVAGPESSNSDTWKTMNKIQGFYKKMSADSVSEHSKSKMITVENMGNLVSDIFMQLYAQRAIASIPRVIGMRGVDLKPVSQITEKFGKSITEKAFQGSLSVAEKTAILEAIPGAKRFLDATRRTSQMARGLSTAYMASTSAVPVVESAKAIGLDDRDTGALFLGTTLGFFGMMKYLEIGEHGIGEWAVRGFGIDDAMSTAKKGIKNEANLISSDLEKIVKEVSPGDPRRYQRFIQAGKNLGQKVVDKLKDPSDWKGAAISESTEEVSEQVMQDSIHVIYNGLAANGWTSTKDKDKQFKFTLGDSSSDYLMNFIGGALGGVLFHVNNNILRKGQNLQDQETKYNLEYLVRNGYKDALVEQIDKMHRKGLLGSTSLSTSYGEVNLPGIGKELTFKPAKNGDVSHNDFIAKALKFQINNISNQIFQEGIPSDIRLAQLYNARTDILVDLGANSSLREDIQNITSTILDLKNQISEVGDPSKIEDVSARDTATKKLTELKQKLNEQNLELSNINSGEKFLEYQKQALFNMSTTFNDPFGAMTLNSYSKATEGKNIYELDPTKQQEVSSKYEQWKSSNRKDKLKEGYQRFTYLNEKFSNNLKEIAKYATQRKGHYETVDFQGNVLKYSLPLDILNKVKDQLDKNELVSETLGQSVDEISDFALKSDRIDSSLISDFRGVFDRTKVSNLFPGISSILDEEDSDGFPVQEDFMLPGLSMNIIESLEKSPINKIEDLYNLYKDTISNHTYTDESYKSYDLELLEKAFNKVRINPDIVNFQAKNILFEQNVASKEINTLNDILRSFSKTRDGQESDFFKTLQKEFQTLGKEERISDYVIRSPKAKEELEDALQLINELEAIKEAATDYVYDIRRNNISGYNSTINNTIKDSNLGVISQDQSSLLQKDFDILKTKINFLITLSKINSEDKLKNQKRSGLVMESLFYGNLIDDENVHNLRAYLNSVVIDGEKFINRDIESAIANATTLRSSYSAIKGNMEVDSDDDTLRRVEFERTEIQKVLYNRAKELITDKGKRTVLNSLFNSEGVEKVFPVEVLSNPRLTDFSHDTKMIEPFDLFVWFNTSLIVDPAEFNAHLKGNPVEGNFDGIESSQYAPFYAQEYSAKVAYGLVSDKEWINEAVKYFGDKEKEKVFLKNINSVLYNSVFIDGTPGSGKTSGVANLLSKILLRKGLNFWTVGPYNTQAENLNGTLEGKATKVLDRKSLLNLLIENSESLYSDLNSKKEGDFISKAKQEVEEIDRTTGKIKKYTWEGYTLNPNFNSFKTLTKESLPDVIFIDEITHFSAMELEIINKAISKLDNPPVLVLMGDLDQNGYKISNDNININQFNTWKTAKLSGSLRVANNIKKENLNFIRSEYKEINKKYYDLSIGLIEGYDKINNADYRIRLGYNEKDGIVYGEKIVSSVSIEDIIPLTISGKIAYITDNPTSDICKQLEGNTRVEIITPENVQGSEYDHVIIDINWGDFVISKEHGLKDLISNLYTLTTRSKEGTIIVNNNLTENGLIKIDQVLENDVILSRLDPELVGKYKNFRVDVINNLLEKYPFDLKDSSIPSISQSKVKDHAPESDVLIRSIFEEKKGIEDPPSFEKIFNSSKVLIYPFNKRLGATYEKGKWSYISNEDLGYFLSDNEKMNQEELLIAKTKLQAIKTSYFHSKDLKKIESIIGDEELDVDKTKLVVRASKYNYKFDRDSETGYNTPHPNGAYVRVALEIPKKDGSKIYFTIGSLSQRDTMEKYQKSTGKIERSIQAYDSLFKQIESDLKVQESVNYEVPTQSLERSSNVKFRKIEGKKYSVKDLKDKNKNAIFSPVYILTGEGSIISKEDETEFKEWINNKRANGRGLAGQAMMLVTYDSTLRPEDLVKIYAKERISKPEVPKVRMVMVDPKGYNFLDWMKKVDDAYKKYKENKSFKPVSSTAAPELAGRIFNSIYNITQMNATSLDSDTKRAVEYSREYMKRIISALGKDHLKIDFNSEQSRLDFIRSIGIDYDIVEGQEVKSVLADKFSTPVLNFKYNHTYNLLLAMKIAWQGGLTVDEKIPIEGIFQYATAKDTKIFTEFMDKELRKQFPQGIFTHPVYMSEGKSTTSTMDYAELSVQNLDDFEVNVNLDYFTGLLDLGKFEKEKTPEEQLRYDKVDAVNGVTDRITEIKKTLVDKSGRLDREVKNIINSIAEFNTSKDLKKNLGLLRSKIETIANEIKGEIEKPIDNQQLLTDNLSTIEDPDLTGLTIINFKPSGRTGKKFAFTAENSNFVVDGIYDSSKNKISKMAKVEKFVKGNDQEIEELKKDLLERSKSIREKFALDEVLKTELRNLDFLIELINNRERLVNPDPSEELKVLEAITIVDYISDEKFKTSFDKYITEQDINTCKG